MLWKDRRNAQTGTRVKAVKAYLMDELPLPRADVVLIIVSFGTAIVDAFTFPRMGVL